MTPAIGFVLGLLIGWLIEWIIDWFYWRRRGQGVKEPADQIPQMQEYLKAEWLSAQEEILYLRERASQLEFEKAQLEKRFMQTQQELDTTRAQSVTTPNLLVPDNLEEIDGVGPVIARRLNQNGIYTFEQLAALTPEILQNTLGDLIQRLSNEQSLIEQARQHALQKESKRAGEQ
ncbi:MAG: hypothetical protein EHM41_19390 [Chloroflexi bacterium]|nr:MAG: hypothetical protein EHM41_19390 [Chloroflexota bacterium]